MIYADDNPGLRDRRVTYPEIPKLREEREMPRERRRSNETRVERMINLCPRLKMSSCIKEDEINVTDIGISGRIKIARGNAYVAKYT